MAKKSGQFSFRRHDTIGTAAAEEDHQFLHACFVDTGDIDVLADFSNSKSIISGRTGSGKTALLSMLPSRVEQVISIAPQSLSLNYIANSNIIRFFSDLGVNLDPFYKLLWRHVFVVEIIQKRFNIDSPAAKAGFLSNLLSPRVERRRQRLAEERRQKALAYIRRFGESFWEDPEYRVKEVVRKLETEFTQGIGGGASVQIGARAWPLGGEAALAGDVSATVSDRIATEARAEYCKRGQEILNSIQVKELDEILALLDELLDDSQKRVMIVIDQLDESWAEDFVRHKLIRALMDTVREFGKVANAKVVICLRKDLLERVVRSTRDSGFQEEKYRSLFLSIRWKKQDLAALLDKRVNKLVRDRYTTARVSAADLLPRHVPVQRPVKQQSALDYMLERTWMRPRDLIEFFNLCIERADSRASITKEMLFAAEAEYSKLRLRSLGDEWHDDYPHLASFITGTLRSRSSEFEVSAIEESCIADVCLEFAAGNPDASDQLGASALAVADAKMTPDSFRKKLLKAFYLVGACGLKTSAYDQMQWSYLNGTVPAVGEISPDSRVSIHPGLWRVLGVRS